MPPWRSTHQAHSKDSGYSDGCYSETFNKYVVGPPNETSMTSVTISEQFTGFTTPDNWQFYSRFQYSDLDPNRKQFRLLRLHPQRLHVYELARKYPKWNQPSPTGENHTDAYMLLRNFKGRRPQRVPPPPNRPPFRMLENGENPPTVPRGWKARSTSHYTARST
jgi:hypothetical protein